MKVILQQDVKGQGKKGQMVEISDGYARNFLLPRKLAVPATAENINTMKMQEKAKKAQEAAEKAEAQAIAEKLAGLTVKVVAKGGNGGRLFGAVTSKEISDALAQQFADQDYDVLLYDEYSSQNRRADYVVQLVKDSGAQGLVLFMQQFCDPEEMEYPYLKKALDDAGIPHIKLGVDQQMRDFGQASTAIQAFADVL